MNRLFSPSFEILLSNRWSKPTWGILAILWMAVIFILSGPWFTSQKTAEFVPEGYDFNSLVRTGAHLLLYFVLAIFIVKTLPDPLKLPLSPLVLAILLSCLCGVTDEIHQHFVPGRHFRIQDMFTDSVGALLIWPFMKVIGRFYPPYRK